MWACSLLLVLISILGGISSRKSVERGIVICSGGGDIFFETVAILEQTKWRINSTLPVAVAHCNELSESQQAVLMGIPDVFVVDICLGGKGKHDFDKQRLRGFFCKPAALLHSPFRQTMIVDSDVIWFNNPELLFEAQGYLETDELYAYVKDLASRVSQWTNHQRKLTAKDTVKQSRQSKNKAFRAPRLFDPNHINDMAQLANSNAYWRHFVSGVGLSLDHMQDSSVLVFDSASHPLTLALIKHMLPSFNVGYGDKEMYWLAATAAGEPFAFEPHVAGSLGDCGAIVHFDPRIPSPEASPFYVNAEYLVDTSKIVAVGDFVDQEPTLVGDAAPAHRPLSISTPIVVNESSTTVFALSPWKNMKHGFYPCGACRHSTCQVTPKAIVDEIKVRQHIVLSLKKGGVDSDYATVRQTFATDLLPAKLTA